MICIIYLYHQKGSINKDDHVNFFNNWITIQKFGRKYARCKYKKMTLFYVFNKTLAFQMRDYHFAKKL